MRRLLLIAGGAIAVVILIVAVVVGYAYFNLNSIIAANRTRLLDRASAAVGRPVQAGAIKAHLGWGVSIELSGVKLADDPAFSQLPFAQADQVLLKVELMPLLHKEIKVTELVLQQPQVRIIRDASGALNVSTLAKKSAVNAGQPGASGAQRQPGLGASANKSAGVSKNGQSTAPVRASTAENVVVDTFIIEDGQVTYIDKQNGGAPVTVKNLNLKVTDFSLVNPFDVTLDLAAFGDRRNLAVSGTAGPIAKDNAIEAGAIPLNLTATVGPFTLAQLKSMPQAAKALPRALALSGAVTLKGKIAGTLDDLRFDVASDLSSNRVAYAPSFDKPAGTTLKFTASGARTAGKLVVQQANLRLADLEAKLTKIELAAGKVRARLDTNKFDLAPIAKLSSAAQPYNPTGTAEIHTAIALEKSKPLLHGTVALANVNATLPNAKTPPIRDLNGTIRLAGNVANLGPLTFKLGSGNAQLQASVDSIQPLHVSYRLSVDKITLAELVPSRTDQGAENLTQVAANGTVSGSGSSLAASTKLSAASGILNNVPFKLLALDASYGANRVKVNSLKFGAFDGSIGATGVATVGAAQAFDFTVDAQNVNMQAALESQHSKAAGTIRGSLTGHIQIAGQGKNLDQIKPTLRGSGRARMLNGKLVGVNVVAQALKKVDNVPGIGALVPAAVVDNHPELFKSPDTDIQEASLTFTIRGPRIISHDIVARSTDYSIFADGWFDLDKNLDLVAKIKMSRPFTTELVAARNNVKYLTNKDSEVEIPLRVSGQLPHPSVAPDVGIIAQRAASHAVQSKVGELIQKKGLGELLKKNGLGGLLGGGSEPPASPGASPSATGGSGGSGGSGGFKNPLKGLFR